MKRATQILIALTLFGLLLPQGAMAESKKSDRTKRMMKYYRSLSPAQQKVFLKKMRAKRKKLASNRAPASFSTMRAQRTVRPQAKDIELNLNILGGMYFINGQQSDENGELGVQSDQSINAGIDAEVIFYKYLGLEVDAQYGFASAQESQNGSDVVFTQIRHRSASAAMLNLNGRLPIPAGTLTFTPKAGVGYGALFVTDETVFASEGDSSSDSDSTVLSGGYWTVGLDTQIGDNWNVGLDFAQSVTPSAKTTFSNSDTELRLQDAAFNRIRLGVTYRIAPNMRVGAQYVRRSTSYVFPIEDQNNVVPFNVDIKQNHVMALFGIDL